jgi:hypothetical protein
MMSAVSESVGVGACLDDGAVEGQPARIVGSRSRRQAWSMAEFAASSVRPCRRRRSAEVLAEHLVACRPADRPTPCLRASFLIGEALHAPITSDPLEQLHPRLHPQSGRSAYDVELGI